MLHLLDSAGIYDRERQITIHIPTVVEMELTKIIVHRVEKDQHEGRVLSNLRDDELPVDDLSLQFVNGLRDTYRRRTAVHYSTFKQFESPSQEATLVFKTQLKDYVNGETSFIEFSKEATVSLKTKLKETPSATGGYVVYADYTHKEKQYLFCAAVEETQGVGITEDLDLTPEEFLNLDDLQVAARVNITEWQSGADAHVSFIRGSKDVSKYFQEFIGVGDAQTGAAAAQNLLEAINSYLREKEVDPETRMRRKADVGHYMSQQQSAKSAVRLDTVATFVEPGNPEDFAEMAQSDDFRVSATFGSTSSAVKKFSIYRVDGDGFSFEFESRAVSKVRYQPDNCQLVISDVSVDSVPKDLLDRQSNSDNE